MDILSRALIFDNVLINAAGTATSGSISTKNLTRLESLVIQIASVTGTGKCKVEYAISDDDVNYGSFDDYTDLVADNTADFTTPEGLTAVALPNPLALYVKFKVTGLAGNPTDTRVSAYLNFRENP
jgi:hypothetical protein